MNIPEVMREGTSLNLSAGIAVAAEASEKSELNLENLRAKIQQHKQK